MILDMHIQLNSIVSIVGLWIKSYISSVSSGQYKCQTKQLSILVLVETVRIMNIIILWHYDFNSILVSVTTATVKFSYYSITLEASSVYGSLHYQTILRKKKRVYYFSFYSSKTNVQQKLSKVMIDIAITMNTVDCRSRYNRADNFKQHKWNRAQNWNTWLQAVKNLKSFHI